MTRQYVVIGAGVSGMAAALILARRGMSVALVEQSARPAPLLRGFTRHGLHFDSGFHYAGGLGSCQALSAYLRHLGVGRHIALEPGQVEDRLRLLDEGRDIPLPYGYDRLGPALEECFPSEGPAVRACLDAVRTIFESTPFLNLEAEAEPEHAPLHAMSLRDALASWTTDPALRQVLGLHHFFYGVSPRRITFLDHARFTGSYYASTRFVQGGGSGLARGFERALQEAGVELHCGRRVESLVCSTAGSLCGVRLQGGEQLDCAGVISTVHPETLVRIAPRQAFRPAYAANLLQLEETPSAYMLFGVCDEPVPLLEQGALHVAPAVGSSLEGLERQPLEQRQLFISKAGTRDAKGRQPVGLICPVDWKAADGLAVGDASRGPDYAERKSRAASLLQARMFEACPELRGRWRMLEAATPMTFRRYVGNPRGSLYGVQHAMDARCPLPQTRLPGLYVAGQAVAGPGVLGATVSAYVACSRILGLRTLLGEVRQCL